MPVIGKELYIKLSKLKLPEFDGDTSEWPELTSLFLATVDSGLVDDSIKMNDLKTQVKEKAKASIQELGLGK